MENTGEFGQLSEDITNEQLFWQAYERSNASYDLREIGSELDSRISKMQDSFYERSHMGFWTLMPTVEEIRELHALKDAQTQVDMAYGTITGTERKGCSMGRPVVYDGPRILL